MKMIGCPVYDRGPLPFKHLKRGHDICKIDICNEYLPIMGQCAAIAAWQESCIVPSGTSVVNMQLVEAFLQALSSSLQSCAASRDRVCQVVPTPLFSQHRSLLCILDRATVDYCTEMKQRTLLLSAGTFPPAESFAEL